MLGPWRYRSPELAGSSARTLRTGRTGRVDRAPRPTPRGAARAPAAALSSRAGTRSRVPGTPLVGGQRDVAGRDRATRRPVVREHVDRVGLDRLAEARWRRPRWRCWRAALASAPADGTRLRAIRVRDRCDEGRLRVSSTARRDAFPVSTTSTAGLRRWYPFRRTSTSLIYGDATNAEQARPAPGVKSTGLRRRGVLAP
jgi:hypothetical protein